MSKTSLYEKKDISKINIDRLTKFLIKHKDNWFNCANSGTSQEDFEDFYHSECSRDKLIYYGEYFLVDLYENELWLCQHTKKRYRNERRKETLSLKPICIVISDCRSNLGNKWNGYWLVPSENMISG